VRADNSLRFESLDCGNYWIFDIVKENKEKGKNQVVSIGCKAWNSFYTVSCEAISFIRLGKEI